MGSFFQSFYKQDNPAPTFEIDEVINYVKASTVAVKKGTKCVDGRYLPHQAHGMLARPGADGGYVMALEAVNRKRNLGLSPIECFNAVFKAVKKLNQKFYLHTDEHTDPEPSTHIGLIGCGHLAKAGRKGLSWEYHVRSGDVKEIVRYARNLCEVTPHVEMVNLTGKHEERGVLLVRSHKYTVLAANPKRKKMHFVYDVDRDQKFMKQLVKEMAIAGVSFEDMLLEADLQLEATLQNLALGLPIYEVTYAGDRPQVNYVKHIVHKPLISRMRVPFAAPQFLRK